MAGKREYYEAPNDNLFMWDFDKQKGWGWDAERLWHTTNKVNEYRFDGDITWLDEISEEDARKKFPDAFKTDPEGDKNGRLDGLTVQEVSSIAARALGDNPDPFEEIMSDNKIPPEYQDEARALYDGVLEDWKNRAPGTTFTLPNEWS